MINNGQCQCDYCFNIFYPEVIATGYPNKATVIWHGYFDMDGNHICDSCHDKIVKFSRAEWEKSRDAK